MSRDPPRVTRDASISGRKRLRYISVLIIAYAVARCNVSNIHLCATQSTQACREVVYWEMSGNDRSLSFLETTQIIHVIDLIVNKFLRDVEFGHTQDYSLAV
jgi:hypothetical protein